METKKPTKKVLLTRAWSGHEPGEIITEWEVTADSMIRKDYGIPYEEPKPQPARPQREVVLPRGPTVETADAPGAAEAAVVSPQITPKAPKPPKNGNKAAKAEPQKEG